MGDSLITISDYKKYQGISSTNEDAVIKILIPKVSEFVKNYCRRSFIDYAFITKQEIFSGGTTSFILEECPVLAVSTVERSLDFGQTYTALVKYTDWVLDGDLVKPIPTLEFPEQLLGYRVSYTGGFLEIPEDLKLATMDILTYYRKNEGAIGSRKLTTSDNIDVEMMLSAKLPGNIRRVIDHYISDVI